MDKNKIIEAATKYVQKGQYDKAIKEYQKLLDADPKDSRILQKVGELHQKKGDNPQAAEYFVKVGESYSSEGFFLKAVAVYKQVIKLDERRIDVNLKLVDLYQQLGLMSDAMAQLQLVSTHYEKTGDTKASLDVLKRMVELDPDNVASRIKLAELYVRDQLNQEAIAAFQKAAQYLKRNNRIDDYVKVAERLVFLDPDNVELARELAQIYLAKQDTKRALAKLQVCFKADPRDVETLHMLAQAFQELGQVSKTISVYKELAKIFDEQDKVDEERQVWEKIRLIAPDDPDAQRRFAPPPAAAAPAAPAARPVEPAAPAQPAPRAAPAAQPVGSLTREQINKLLTETDVYVKYGLHDKAQEHLKKVFAADPGNLDGHDKAYQLAKASGQHARAEEELVEIVRLASAQGDLARAQARLQTLLEANPGHPAVKGFLETVGAPAPEAPEEAAEIADDSILVDPEEVAEEVVEEPALAEEAIVAEAGEDEALIAEDEPLVAEPEPGGAEDEALALASSDDMVSADDSLVVAEDEASADEIVAGDSDFAADSDESSSEGDLALVNMEADGEVTRVTRVEKDIEATDDGLGEVSDQDATRITRLPLQPPVKGPMVPQEAADEATGEAEGEAEGEEAGDPAGEEIEEAAFFIDQGVLDEAREILETVMLAYPGHARARELMAALEAEEAGAEAGASGEEAAAPAAEPAAEEPPADASFDLAAELAEELGDANVAEESEPLAPGDDGFQISAEDVFAEFKKGVSKVVKPEDVDTHYDLGIAYKEMGLSDDAVGEFEQALSGAQGKPREVDCYTMIGACRQDKGDHAGAIEALRKGLALPQITPDGAHSMQFEIAAAYEQLGKPGKALAYYQKVASSDPKFRDVKTAAERLAAQGVKPEEDPPAATAARAAKPTTKANLVAKPVNGANGVGAVKSGSKEPASPGPSRKIGYV